eukprot:m.124830 g.124830  ORF g.124830 m.124830 type:complete len:327 (-) comp13787_c0_seq2:193-1173(-)
MHGDAMGLLMRNNPCSSTLYRLIVYFKRRFLIDLFDSQHTHFKRFSLTKDKMSAVAVRYVADLLRETTQLSALYLQKLRLVLEGICYLGEALKVNTTLVTISLQNCRLGNEGVKPITEALRVNNTILEVNLAGNEIGDIGAGYLAEVLRVNTTMTDLSLYNNSIEYVGAKALAEALACNFSIMKINLEFNEIRFLGEWELFKAGRIQRMEVSPDFQALQVDMEKRDEVVHKAIFGAPDPIFLRQHLLKDNNTNEFMAYLLSGVDHRLVPQDPTTADEELFFQLLSLGLAKPVLYKNESPYDWARGMPIFSQMFKACADLLDLECEF